MNTPRRCVAVLHEEVPSTAGPEAQDTLTQVREVSDALRELGWQPVAVPVTLRLDRLQARLTALRPRLVFNLVESLAGHDALLGTVPLLLEGLGIPYTGAGAAALVGTGDKISAKYRLRAAGIPVPPAWDAVDTARPPAGGAERWIVKSVWQQASWGLDEGSVVDTAAVAGRIRECRHRLGGEWFAERFIPGREFNVALLAGPDGPEVLPVAEIRFEGFPPGVPRMVGFAAKWQPDAPEYRGTVRHFDFAAADAGILHRLRALALRGWNVFGLRGYARVDFRVDADGHPWVLEVNANPCLSADAGFAAAAATAGLSQTGVVERIVRAALRLSSEIEVAGEPLPPATRLQRGA